MPKVIALYDNKMGYSTWVADLVAYVTMKQFESERVSKSQTDEPLVQASIRRSRRHQHEELKS